MRDVFIDPKLLKREKVQVFLIKKAAMQIEPTSRQKLYQIYNKTVDVENCRLFLAYEFQNENIIYIKEARKAVKKWKPP